MAFFDCPILIIDDQDLIWEADEHSKMLFGSPSGKVDYAAGKIYEKGLGHDILEEPIATLTKKNDVTEIRDEKLGEFSAPILHIKGDNIYTPKKYTAILDAPGAYIRHENPGSSQYNPGPSASDDPQPPKSAPSGLGSAVMKFGGMLLAFYCVVVAVGNAMPIRLSIVLAIALVAGLVYMEWFTKKKVNKKAFRIALWAVLIWFTFCGSIILRYFF